MRDKSRIEPLLNKIKAFWLDNQDLRAGQVIYMLAEHLRHPDIFFPEDKEWDKSIDILIKQSCERYGKHDCDREKHNCEGCKHYDKSELELPCMICCGTEIKGLKGYKKDCYFRDENLNDKTTGLTKDKKEILKSVVGSASLEGLDLSKDSEDD